MVEEFEEAQLTAPQAEDAAQTRAVNWRNVGLFLGLTFGLTWLLDLLLWLKGGLNAPAAGQLLALQMLLPAFSALLLGSYVFKDSPIYFKSNRTLSRWFIYYFFLLTAIYLGAGLAALFKPETMMTISPVLLLAGLVGLALLVALRRVGGKDTFAAVGMAGGQPIYWLILGLGVVAYFGVSSLLNYLFKLGELVNFASVIASAPGAAALPPRVMMTIVLLQAIVLGPFLGLVVTFGEEYGWRGFLQTALNPLGRARATLLIGMIWGVWHWPVIWMGYNYPGQPALGSLLMVGLCILLAFFLAYAVFKARGLWIAAFLHALVNQSSSVYMGLVVKPAASHLAFGIGALGLLLGGAVILLLLRDPVWKER